MTSPPYWPKLLFAVVLPVVLFGFAAASADFAQAEAQSGQSETGARQGNPHRGNNKPICAIAGDNPAQSAAAPRDDLACGRSTRAQPALQRDRRRDQAERRAQRDPSSRHWLCRLYPRGRRSCQTPSHVRHQWRPGRGFGLARPWRHGTLALAARARRALTLSAADPIDNADTWLDFTDLVFIDPPGTGYGRRPRPKAETPRRHLLFGRRRHRRARGRNAQVAGRNKRRESPKFIAGESYGGFPRPEARPPLQDPETSESLA